ncbi:ABC transporter permease [Pseudochelatococcus sp. B33]
MSRVVSTEVTPSNGTKFDMERLLANDTLMACLALLVFMALWEASVILFNVQPYILPAPSAIAGRVIEDLTAGHILRHFPITFLEVCLAFVLASVTGLIAGTAIALVPIVERTVFPLILSIQTVPKVAIAPLFLIWFGFGIQSKIITGALIAFFPILINIVAGLKAVDGQQLLLMRALRATPSQTFFKLRLPSMLPYLFAGLQIGLVFAVIGVIVGEFVGATRGLGVLIIIRQGTIDVAGMFSVLIYLSFMGVALSAILRRVARRYTFWERPRN